jgi:phage/plasmid-associated DNA primase
VADKSDIKRQQYETLTEAHRFANFHGSTLYQPTPTDPYLPLTSSQLARLLYQHFPFATTTQIKEIEHKVRNDSQDHSNLDHLIGFPLKTWNTKTLEWEAPQDTILRSPIAPDPTHAPQAQAYLLQLAAGDQLLAQDYLQALAPLFMYTKPTGVVWFVGNGANGKSALINAVYRIIGHHLTSLTVGAIEDGRDTLLLNGVIGNICRESSEGRIEDSERYKAIGTHESFRVHKFNSQEMVQISTNFHTVFNANNIPIFSDKTEGARRRTLVVPFPARFKDDPNFESRTFTPAFLGGLLHLILEATYIIRDNYTQYAFSPATLGAKEEYDAEVNSAEAFLAYLREKNIKAFTNYNQLRIAYDSWCSDHGLVPLGITSLKRVMTRLANATSATIRDGETVRRWYLLDNTTTTEAKDLQSFDNGFCVGIKAPPPATPAPVQLGTDW